MPFFFFKEFSFDYTRTLWVLVDYARTPPVFLMTPDESNGWPAMLWSINLGFVFAF